MAAVASAGRRRGSRARRRWRRRWRAAGRSSKEVRGDGGDHAAAACRGRRGPVRRGARRRRRAAAGCRRRRTGSIDVHVTWPDAPAAARASAGPNPCGVRAPPAGGDRRRSRASPGAVAIVEDAAPGPGAGHAGRAAGRAGRRGCRVEPAVALAGAAGAEIDVASAEPARRRVTLAAPGGRAGARCSPPARSRPRRAARSTCRGPAPRRRWSPTRRSSTRFATTAAPDELSWVIVAGGPVAVTDAHGRATSWRGRAPGHHRVRVWLPPRAPGAAPTTATGEVDVVAEPARRAGGPPGRAMTWTVPVALEDALWDAARRHLPPALARRPGADRRGRRPVAPLHQRPRALARAGPAPRRSRGPRPVLHRSPTPPRSGCRWPSSPAATSIRGARRSASSISAPAAAR